MATADTLKIAPDLEKLTPSTSLDRDRNERTIDFENNSSKEGSFTKGKHSSLNSNPAGMEAELSDFDLESEDKPQ